MASDTVTVQVETLPLDGGRVLNVVLFENPATGTRTLTLSVGWREDGPAPWGQEAALELPASIRGDLVDALERLGDA